MIAIPPSQLIAKYLIDQLVAVAVGGGADWSVYVAHLADTPDKAICVYDLDADQDGRIASGERIEHPLFQIRIRGTDYASSWLKGVQIRDALDAVSKTEVVLNFVTYTLHSVMRTSSLIPLGTDPETRLINFTLNGQLTVT